MQLPHRCKQGACNTCTNAQATSIQVQELPNSVDEYSTCLQYSQQNTVSNGAQTVLGTAHIPNAPMAPTMMQQSISNTGVNSAK